MTKKCKECGRFCEDVLYEDNNCYCDDDCYGKYHKDDTVYTVGIKYLSKLILCVCVFIFTITMIYNIVFN